MSHLAGLIIVHRLNQLRFGVHDEGAIARDRFVDRLPGHDQEPAVFVNDNSHLRAVSAADNQLSLSSLLSPVDGGAAVQNKERRVVSLG